MRPILVLLRCLLHLQEVHRILLAGAKFELLVLVLPSVPRVRRGSLVLILMQLEMQFEKAVNGKIFR